jgi:cytochrome c oxidase cbb3-type subunit 4
MEMLDSLHALLRPYWVVWMMALFLGIVAWALWPKRKAEMEQHARIPLEGDDPDSQGGR